MARLDGYALSALRRLKQNQKLEVDRAFLVYHTLAFIHKELRTLEDKSVLADSHPEVSAQIFYHFDDRESGELLVQKYSESVHSQKRQIAFRVKEVLQTRNLTSERPEQVLGMFSVPENYAHRKLKMSELDE